MPVIHVIPPPCVIASPSFGHVAAWEYAGEGKTPVRNTEPLNYEFVHMSVRNYK